MTVPSRTRRTLAVRVALPSVTMQPAMRPTLEALKVCLISASPTRLLDLDRLQQALHRVAQVFGDFVDDRVGADVDALALAGAAGVGQRPHVEADDDRVGGRGQHHVGLVDATGLGVDDVDRDPLLRDFGDLVLERLQRAGDIGLEDDVELLDVALLDAGEDLVEADLARLAAGQGLGLEAVGALLGELAGAAVVLDRLDELAGVADAVEAEHLDRHPRAGGLDPRRR